MTSSPLRVNQMKKSFRNIPGNIRNNIRKVNDKPFVIYSVVKVRIGSHFPNLPGLVIGANPVNDFETLPNPSSGTWARRNIQGWDITLKDQPKYTKSFSHESPNFGDWSRGSHTVTIEREVYPHILFPGHGSVIKVHELKRDDTHVTLGLELDRIFDSVPTDTRELLFALNVFQEAVGSSAIRSTDEPIQSYIGSLQIDWEILPVGEREEVLRQIHTRLKPTPEEARVIDERMDLLLSLKPKDLLTGSSGFARYVGARYGDELVAFENIRYGNALYIMFSDWERLSGMSRLNLINSEEKFERIVHRTGWESTAKSIIREYKPRY